MGCELRDRRPVRSICSRSLGAQVIHGRLQGRELSSEALRRRRGSLLSRRRLSLQRDDAGLQAIDLRLQGLLRDRGCRLRRRRLGRVRLALGSECLSQGRRLWRAGNRGQVR